jgi:hypothetical protein
MTALAMLAVFTAKADPKPESASCAECAGKQQQEMQRRFDLDDDGQLSMHERHLMQSKLMAERTQREHEELNEKQRQEREALNDRQRERRRELERQHRKEREEQQRRQRSL